MSTAATVSFRWLDLLEKEFDNSYMDLEKLARTFSDDFDFVETSEVLRKLLSNLGQCFVQLVHKSQTIFQTNAKLEAELVHLREELSVAQASLFKTESEKKYLICCLQSTLIDNHKLRNTKDGSTMSGDVAQDNLLCESIQMRLAKEMSAIQRVDWDKKRLEEKCFQLERENGDLRKNRIEIESELVGARLDAKYLDKELAGRIQQIQILLAANTSHEHKQKVWSQIEASMHLQRSKTIANMCFSKQRVKDSARKESSTTTSNTSSTSPQISTSESTKSESTNLNDATSTVSNGMTSPMKANGTKAGSNRFKQVHFHKHDTEDLGMAILGGKEYGLPIMISEIFPESAVSRCAKICAGDILLAVNGDTFADLNHNEAVKYLSALRGSIRFDLENTIEADIDEVCDTAAHYYEFYETDSDDRNPRKSSQPERIFLQHPGKAKPAETKKPGKEPSPTEKELPAVHNASPKKSKDPDQSKQ